MAKADQIKKLVASYGRPAEFRAATLKIIEEEHRIGHRPFAAALKKMLDAHVTDSPASTGGLAHIDQITDPASELLDVTEPKRGLGDIVLNSEARASFDRLIEEQRRGDELRRHRLPVRAKLLLCGPPGCGKTLSAEVIARELSLPLMTAKIDMLISSMLGQTASNLRRMFEYSARKPCVLFLDEFDAIARSRTDSGEHNELRRVVNSLLRMIDKYQTRGVLIAATNLESSLDAAIWRRFDDSVNLGPPSADDARKLLELTFKNYPVNFDVAGVVPKLTGLSYAEIERVAFEAIKTSVLKKHKAVSETHLAAALKAETRRQANRGSDRSSR